MENAIQTDPLPNLAVVSVFGINLLEFKVAKVLKVLQQWESEQDGDQ